MGSVALHTVRDQEGRKTSTGKRRSLTVSTWRPQFGWGRDKEGPVEQVTKIASPIKVRICNCLSLTRPSRPLHCASSRSRGGLGRPLTVTLLQARALIGQNGDRCRSDRHPCDVPNQLAPVHRIYRRKRLVDTSRLFGSNRRHHTLGD